MAWCASWWSCISGQNLLMTHTPTLPITKIWSACSSPSRMVALLWQAQGHQLCTKAGVGHLWDSPVGPPARRQDLHPLFWRPRPVLTLKGVRQEQSNDRFQLALAPIFTLSHIIIHYCQILLSIRWIFSDSPCGPPPHQLHATRPYTSKDAGPCTKAW